MNRPASLSGGFGEFFELFDGGGGLFGDGVFGDELTVFIDGDPKGALGQVTDVPLGSDDFVAFAKEVADGASLGRRLDDNQIAHGLSLYAEINVPVL